MWFTDVPRTPETAVQVPSNVDFHPASPSPCLPVKIGLSQVSWLQVALHGIPAETRAIVFMSPNHVPKPGRALSKRYHPTEGALGMKKRVQMPT